MALTFEQLDALLTPANGRLSIAGSSLETPAVTQLFRDFFKDGTLTLTDCVRVADPAQQLVTLTGSVAPDTFLNVKQGRLASGRFTLQANGEVAVVLIIEVGDADWTLANAFPTLVNSTLDHLTYTAPRFTLDSTAPLTLPPNFRASFGLPPNVPLVTKHLVKGLSFRASIAFRNYLVALRAFFDTPIEVEGAIEVVFQGRLEPPGVDAMPQLLLLPLTEDGRTRTIGGYTFLFALELASLLDEFEGPDNLSVTVVPLGALAARTEFVAGTVRIPVSSYVYMDDGGELIFNVGTAPDIAIAKQQLPSLLGGTDVSALLDPPGFPIYEAMLLTNTALGIRISPLDLEFITLGAAIEPEKSWTLIPGLVSVRSIGFLISVSNAGGSFDPTAAVYAHAILLDNPNVTLSAAVALPQLAFDIELRETVPLDLKQMVFDLVGESIPLPVITGATFQMTGEVETSTYTFESRIEQVWTLVGTLENGLTLRDVDLKLSSTLVGVRGSVFAALSLGGAQLYVSAEYDTNGGWTFSGGTLPGQDISLSDLFKDLLRIFGIREPPGLPIDIRLRKLDITYNTLTSAFTLAAAVTIPAASINLADIPLIGEWLDPNDRITLETIEFSVLTIGGDAPENATRVTLRFRVKFGTTDSVQIEIPLMGPDTPPPPPQKPEQPSEATYPTEGSGEFTPAQRSFGPLRVEKLGFTLNDRGIGVQFNASLSMNAMLFEILGLGMTIPLTAPWIPEFHLQGLTVTYATPAFAMAGGLVKVDNPAYLQFDGALIVRAKKFAMSAFGSYATSKPPSMFVFALLDVPIGGPPVFFVTGMSGGFGFNRTLKLPTLLEIPKYPLVAGAKVSTNPFGPDPTLAKFLEVMGKYMNVSIGDYWLAAGIAFSSFKMVESSALLTVGFGTRFQVGILGMSTLSVPPDTKEPLARARLVLEAVFDPDDGLISIAAQLTPDSYVLSKDCKITGGFAFYLWFSPNAFAGDFVITLGGYNPYYTKPSHYPVVPRIGMNWNVAGSPLVIKAEGYFALTPHAIMAGGLMAATWRLGPITAWFTMSADFLIQWKPFFYDIRAGVSFGVRLTVNIWVIRFTISVTVGAELHLWGPSFSGKAVIDLGVFSFTIRFGAGADRRPPPIDWPEFRRSFLPEPAETVKTLIPNGLLKDIRSERAGVDYVVDPQLFQLVVQTMVPAKSVTLNGAALPPEWNASFGIGPMALPIEKVSSDLTINIASAGNPFNAIAVDVTNEPAPKALWLYDPAPAKTLNKEALLPNVPQGATLTPRPAPAANSVPIDVRTLLYAPEATEPIAWSPDVAPRTNPFAGLEPIPTMTSTIDDSDVRDKRRRIVVAMRLADFNLEPDLDTAPMTNPNELGLLDPPVLTPLGFREGS